VKYGATQTTDGQGLAPLAKDLEHDRTETWSESGTV